MRAAAAATQAHISNVNGLRRVRGAVDCAEEVGEDTGVDGDCKRHLLLDTSIFNKIFLILMLNTFMTTTMLDVSIGDEKSMTLALALDMVTSDKPTSVSCSKI